MYSAHEQQIMSLLSQNFWEYGMQWRENLIKQADERGRK